MLLEEHLGYFEYEYLIVDEQDLFFHREITSSPFPGVPPCSMFCVGLEGQS